MIWKLFCSQHDKNGFFPTTSFPSTCSLLTSGKVFFFAVWTITKEIFNYSKYYIYLAFKMAKPYVFIVLYIHELVIHDTLKYQLLLNTWRLLLQAFDFYEGYNVVVSWCGLAVKLPPIHLLTPHSRMGQRMRTDPFAYPCVLAGIVEWETEDILVCELCSAVIDVLVCYPAQCFGSRL